MVVEVAEWSKALDSGSSPKGRGFKSRPLHFLSPATNFRNPPKTQMILFPFQQ